VANNPFDRIPLYALEKPFADDVNQLQTQSDYALRWALQFIGSYQPFNTFASGAAGQGFIGDSFRLVSVSSMSIGILAGVGFVPGTGGQPTNIGGALNMNDPETLKPVVMTGLNSVTVPAADPTNPRIDIVEVTNQHIALVDNQTRDVLNLATDTFIPTLLPKLLTWILNGTANVSVNGTAAINLKMGTPAGSPTAPTVDAGYTKVGEIYVRAATASILSSDLNDTRPLWLPGGVGMIQAQVSVNLATGALTNFVARAPVGAHVVATPHGSSGSYGVKWYVWGGNILPAVAGATNIPFSVTASDDTRLTPSTGTQLVQCSGEAYAAATGDNIAVSSTGVPSGATIGTNQFVEVIITTPYIFDQPSLAVAQNATVCPSRELIVNLTMALGGI
jgi:hypothetical protein